MYVKAYDMLPLNQYWKNEQKNMYAKHNHFIFFYCKEVIEHKKTSVTGNKRNIFFHMISFLCFMLLFYFWLNISVGKK